uniref:uncharacterized protein LOC105349631 n=1 Tax=Fragaria vesca subsp. vesca TaxID=101020 RepID=UPI0005CA2741|nr:PREDICTED: uncharacterized protein LOC105349631 [Fragaria vesca subsp. vesca]
MAFATNNRVSIITLLALLVLAASSAAFARSVSDDHASSPIQSEGSAKPEDIVDIGLCAIECAGKCLHKRSSLGKAFCMAKCLVKCSINQANVKPELYHCALGCAYKSSAETTFSGSDAHVDNNYLGSCYNKCEESFQG